jgi:hypothetical protein
VAQRKQGAAFKDMRVFMDHRGATILLDFRASSGFGAMGIGQLTKAMAAFLKEVDDAHHMALMRGPDTTVTEAVESYKNDLGFLVTCSYDLKDIIDLLTEHWTDNDYEVPQEPHLTTDVLDEVEEALHSAGWKVTRK